MPLPTGDARDRGQSASRLPVDVERSRVAESTVFDGGKRLNGCKPRSALGRDHTNGLLHQYFPKGSSRPVLRPPVESGQYASAQIARFVGENGITRSMGKTGICWDSAMAESFFATLKTEFYYRRVWPTKTRARLAVGAWIEDRYNRRRRHSAIGQISPVTFDVQSINQTAAEPQAA